MIPRWILVGVGINFLAVLGAVLLFFQTKDPAPLALAFQFSFYAWVVVLVVRVLVRGIPVRIVSDERKGP